MNPQALAFVPKPKSPGGKASSNDLAKVAENSKLRAGAASFVPKGSPPAAGSTPATAPPTYTAAVANSSRPATPNTPTAPALNGGGTSPNKDHRMSPDATPYTPTRFRGTPTSGTAPQFPSAPPQPQAPASVAAAVAAPKVAEAAKPESPAGPRFVPEIPFAHSKLACAPGAAITAPPEDKEIPKFDCNWKLYVDDHPTRPQVVIGGTAPPAGDGAYNPVEIKLISNIADFWRLWRHVPPASNIPGTTSFTYYWFRRDIKPSWEDERNKNGGTLTINVYDKDMPALMDKAAAEDAFMATVCMLTGEAVPEAAGVNGVVLKLRKTGKWALQLWTSSSTKSTHQAVFDGLKKELAKLLPPECLANVPFMPHNAAPATPAAAAPKRPRGGKMPPLKLAPKPEPTHFLS